MVISDQEKKRKKSGFMEEGTAGRSSERLESGLPPKLMEDFAPMATWHELESQHSLFSWAPDPERLILVTGGTGRNANAHGMVYLNALRTLGTFVTHNGLACKDGTFSGLQLKAF
uniref:Uncharacterized protein n=1 Tax=Populus alba TaxID=43335 RepID=A0A4U5Q1V1_POPAL|nr:hypothetical protein D5086_0000147350 [Populus alba]